MHLVSLLLAFQLFDGLDLKPGFTAAAQVRSFSSVPAYMEGSLHGGWQSRFGLGTYAHLGRTRGVPVQSRGVGLSWRLGRHQWASEVTEHRGQGATLSRWWARYRVLFSREWVAGVRVSPGPPPQGIVTLSWCSEPWSMGVQWDREILIVVGVHTADHLWIGVGWESGLATAAHWRVGNGELTLKQRRHGLLGSVLEASVRWHID